MLDFFRNDPGILLLLFLEDCRFNIALLFIIYKVPFTIYANVGLQAIKVAGPCPWEQAALNVFEKMNELDPSDK